MKSGVLTSTLRVYELYKKRAFYGVAAEQAWKKLFVEYKKRYPDLSADLERRLRGELPAGWAEKLPKYTSSDVVSLLLSSRKHYSIQEEC